MILELELKEEKSVGSTRERFHSIENEPELIKNPIENQVTNNNQKRHKSNPH